MLNINNGGVGGSNKVPYTGATTDVNLGANDIYANSFIASGTGATTYNDKVVINDGLYVDGLTCGTLQGILAGSGGTVFSIGSTGTAGYVLQSDGDNTYSWASLGTASHDAVTIGTDAAGNSNGLSLSSQEISMGTASPTVVGSLSTALYATFNSKLAYITTGILGVSAPFNTDATRYVLGGAVNISLNTATVWATTFSGTNFYGGTHSGSAVQATTISGTTVYAVTLSGTTARVSTGIVGSLNGVFFSTGGIMTAIATDSVGKFLVQSGANTYAWANTASQAGLGTDIVVPYLGGVSDLLLGSYKLSANAITCGTLQGIVVGTGGSFFSVDTGAVGSFFVQSGANVYSWANTSAVAGVDTAVVVPYLGAVSDLNLGSFDLLADIITGSAVRATIISGTTVYATTFSGTTARISTGIVGSLHGIFFSTGGVMTALATGSVGAFLAQSGANIYSWVNTAASLPTVTTGIISGLLPITTDNTRFVLGGALQMSLNTATIWATTLSATNLYGGTHSGGDFKATTVWATTLSGTNVYATTFSGTTVKANTLSSTTLYATTISGTNVYATTTSVTTSKATTFSGTTLYATTSSAVIARASTQYVIASANPTQTAAGGIGVKSTTTSGGGFRVYTDAEYTIPVYQSKSFCITAPAGAATYLLWRAPYNLLIKNVYCYASGGTVTGAVYEADGNGATVVTATVNAAITGTTTTASNVVNATIDAGDFIDWITTSTGGTTTQFSCSIYYSMDTS